MQEMINKLFLMIYIVAIHYKTFAQYDGGDGDSDEYIPNESEWKDINDKHKDKGKHKHIEKNIKHKKAMIISKRMIIEAKCKSKIKVVVLDIKLNEKKILGVPFYDDNEYDMKQQPQHYDLREFNKTKYFFEGSWDLIGLNEVKYT